MDKDGRISLWFIGFIPEMAYLFFFFFFFARIEEKEINYRKKFFISISNQFLIIQTVIQREREINFLRKNFLDFMFDEKKKKRIEHSMWFSSERFDSLWEQSWNKQSHHKW